MVNMLATSVVDRGFEYRSDKTKNYDNGIWFFAYLECGRSCVRSRVGYKQKL